MIFTLIALLSMPMNANAEEQEATVEMNEYYSKHVEMKKKLEQEYLEYIRAKLAEDPNHDFTRQ